MTDRRVAVVVLAAGASVRFGGPKQVALLRGEPLLVHVVRAATAAEDVHEVVVVVAAGAGAVAAAVPDHPRVRVVENPDSSAGQSTSLRAGLAALGDDIGAAVVVLADEPQLEPAAIDAVVQAWRRGAPVARTVYADRPGHPVVFDRSVWPQLHELSGDVGARRLLRDGAVADVPRRGPAPVDVDRPADLDAVRGRASSPPGGRGGA